MTAKSAPNATSAEVERSPIQGSTFQTSKRSSVAMIPRIVTTPIVAIKATFFSSCGLSHMVLTVTADHISHARTLPVPKSIMAERKIRSASIRSIRGPMYCCGSISASCSTAAGRKSPLRGTSHVNTVGTDARSVSKVLRSAGAVKDSSCRSLS